MSQLQLVCRIKEVETAAKEINIFLCLRTFLLMPVSPLASSTNVWFICFSTFIYLKTTSTVNLIALVAQVMELVRSTVFVT